MPPQTTFLTYQTHAFAQNFWDPSLNDPKVTYAAGKEFIVLETNTACCGDFACDSDSCAACPYLIDPALQAVSIGQTQILHNRGVSQIHNLFRSCPDQHVDFYVDRRPHARPLRLDRGRSNGRKGVPTPPRYAAHKDGQTHQTRAPPDYLTDTNDANDTEFNFPSS
ncbi:hypothetical protein FRC00_007346 [Tulasnella sp. 408]|nr:hypothetical protein FRC00_007346 [Tulasnella sp. 408]